MYRKAVRAVVNLCYDDDDDDDDDDYVLANSAVAYISGMY